MIFQSEILSSEEGNFLLKIARRSLLSAVCNQSNENLSASSVWPNRGLFVTLWQGDQTRGCIGMPYPKEEISLQSAVEEMTVHAACKDRRFAPVTADELSQIVIELSILTTPQKIALEEIVLGKHGLILQHEEKKALFLPEVPIKKNWDLETCLENLADKGGIEKRAWLTGALLSAFEVQTFREK